ncbi:hypothetical protein SELMODRAFT_410829 [Selaginella moellendorffii]|uniref:Thioredoxin domain-containing protein n=1 Tax=Selaginella moellendorffii TaxID=88036 RepID=D8RG01_SELML|nr:uncharacterized protein LOC9646262 [Selaginella moellendorffii]EFJ28953.1 hypothetical protein SELMODRAFT_410829 [Selaginella moellendorffii]|eukprot:XP_002969829.1 uncharacterized protein LOC9646262 [Selaginella moellendorffii]
MGSIMRASIARLANALGSGGALAGRMIREEQSVRHDQARFFWSISRAISRGDRKAANLKERAKIMEDIDQGYFFDFKDFKKHSGKVVATSTALDPPASATIFPKSTVYTPTRESSIFPLNRNSCVTLVCLSFRNSAEAMVDSWVSPLREAFPSTSDIQVIELSWVESGVLSFVPVRHLFLMCINSSKACTKADRKLLYAFGDSYDFRKELRVTNRLTGYMFLVDRAGRIRWRSSGQASPEEASHLVSCTASLLQES